ncbi:MAG: leucine-rich repeat protein, partial [Lachnospiraceae bacterium]|nr:leucine-rich repeat protein [Lachnospiraceae bacterium]
IVQGLEGRGRDAADGNYGSNKITADSNPLLAQVTDVADYAFANNEEVVQVDLSKTNIRDIANGTFNGCSELMEVDLPEKTKLVGDFALGGVNLKNFTLVVPNKDCQISQKVFQMDESDMNPSVKGVTIKGIMLDEDGDRSTTYDSFLKLQEKFGENNVVWSELGKSYVLRFYDDNFSIISSEVVDVRDGETSATLSNPPREPKKTGYTFDYWICPKVTDENGKPLTGAATYSNVTEDRDIYPIFKEDPSSVVSDGKDYRLTVENGKALVNGVITSNFPMTLKGETTVTVIANDEANFKVWTITPGTYTSLITSPSIFTTTFTMPNADVTVTANSAIGGSTDTPNPDGTYTVTVNNGTGGGNYRPGVTVTITANTAPTGQTFTNWTTTTASVSLANPNNTSTTFVMPASNVTVTANYSGGNNQGGNTGDGNNNNNATKYKVTVNYGSGSGEYAAGETVNIAANAPESSNRVFSRWTTSNSGLGFANANAVSTSFVMPATDVTVTANYRVRTSDDDDDDDNTSRRPGTNTSTRTVTNRPGSSTNTTGTTGTVNNPANG